jgi:hypothetical protein
MAIYTIPRPNAPIAGQNPPATQWYNYFNYLSSLATPTDLQTEIDALAEKVNSIPGGFNLKAIDSIAMTGSSTAGGLVQISLVGDTDSPNALSFYGALDAGNPGWQNFSGNFENATDMLDLSDVTLITGGSLLKYGFDAKGRLSESDTATTTDLPEGTNLYFTNDRVYRASKTQFVEGSNIAISYNDTLDQITFSSTGGGSVGGMIYVGTWDASTGSPPSGAPVKGQYWIVSVAGTTNLSGITNWQVHDWAVYDGTQWDQIQNDRVGLLLSANNLSDVATPSVALANLGGQPLLVRTTASITSASGAAANGTVVMGKQTTLLHLLSNSPLRIRLYTTVAAQTADQSRSVFDYPAPGSGLLFEGVTTADLTGFDIDSCNAFNNEGTVTTAIAYRIEPALAVSTTATFTYTVTQS